MEYTECMALATQFHMHLDVSLESYATHMLVLVVHSYESVSLLAAASWTLLAVITYKHTEP
jgi:hypothetical protein